MLCSGLANKKGGIEKEGGTQKNDSNLEKLKRIAISSKVEVMMISSRQIEKQLESSSSSMAAKMKMCRWWTEVGRLGFWAYYHKLEGNSLYWASILLHAIVFLNRPILYKQAITYNVHCISYNDTDLVCYVYNSSSMYNGPCNIKSPRFKVKIQLGTKLNVEYANYIFTCSPILLATTWVNVLLVLLVKSNCDDVDETWQCCRHYNTRGYLNMFNQAFLCMYITSYSVILSVHLKPKHTTPPITSKPNMNHKHHHSLPYARLLRESLEKVRFLSIEPKLCSANAINPNMTLLIRVVSSKNIPISAVNRAIKNFWGFNNPFHTEDYNNNIFKITVASEDDLRYLCFHTPGIVLSQHAFIRLWNANTPYNLVDTMHSSVWIQVRDLAISQNTIDNLLRLSNRLGQLEMIDYNFEDLEKNSVLRFKVYIAVDEPLLTGVFTTQEDGICWIKFYYENVGLVCFDCGVIGHHRDNCMKPAKKKGRETSEYLLTDWNVRMMIRSPTKPLNRLYWKNGSAFEHFEYIHKRNRNYGLEEQGTTRREESRQEYDKGYRYYKDGNLEIMETARASGYSEKRYVGNSSRGDERVRLDRSSNKGDDFIPIEVEDQSENSGAASYHSTTEKEAEHDNHLSMLIYKRMEDGNSETSGKKRPRMWGVGTLDDDQFDGIGIGMNASRQESSSVGTGTAGKEGDGLDFGSNRTLMGASPAHKQVTKEI